MLWKFPVFWGTRQRSSPYSNTLSAQTSPNQCGVLSPIKLTKTNWWMVFIFDLVLEFSILSVKQQLEGKQVPLRHAYPLRLIVGRGYWSHDASCDDVQISCSSLCHIHGLLSTVAVRNLWPQMCSSASEYVHKTRNWVDSGTTGRPCKRATMLFCYSRHSHQAGARSSGGRGAHHTMHSPDTAAETELVPLHNKASLFTHLLYVLWFLFWP